VIERLEVDGFKSLRDISLETRSLNILVGPNASGKSTLLQTLLLLRQSADPTGQVEVLSLSGELYEAGTPLDAIHPAAGHVVTIGVASEMGEWTGRFEHRREAERLGGERRLAATTQGRLAPTIFERNGRFAYLNAERIGPRVSYELPLTGEELSGRVGKQGEYTTALLARAFNSDYVAPTWNKEIAGHFDKVLHVIAEHERSGRLADTQGSLFRLCNAMLGWVIPGAEFSATEHSETDTATILFTRDPNGIKAKTRPTHVGFGLSYTLPIIVAALSLSRGGLLLVENPEAHLHPLSQSRMGVFLALVASLGHQIFVETHSDHFVNGVRLAARFGLLPQGSGRFFFFENTLASEHSRITPIDLDARGRLSDWPPGFFDQIERDLARI